MVEWRIQCDAIGCTARVVARSNTDENCVVKVRSIASQAGWRVEPGDDRCPTHATTQSKPGRFI